MVKRYHRVILARFSLVSLLATPVFRALPTIEERLAADQVVSQTKILAVNAASLAEINQRAREVDGVVQEIATASEQQSQGVSQITTAVASMERITQTNAATAEESASAAQELNAETMCLHDAINQLNRRGGAEVTRESGVAHRAPPAVKPHPTAQAVAAA